MPETLEPGSAGVAVFLGHVSQETRERKGYAAALKRAGWRVAWVDGGDFARLDAEIATGWPSAMVIDADVSALLPRTIASLPCPTVTMQIDTFRYPATRLRRSMLFDFVACFHPGWDATFRTRGHPGAFLLPHAVERDWPRPSSGREWEIGWVGRLDSPFYSARRRLLPSLAAAFRMNPSWQRRSTADQMAEVYGRSRVVVNVSRGDYPQDANLRVFEAMGSGAALVTRIPSELSALGFIEGEHFVGYGSEAGLVETIRDLLDDARRLESVAAAGQALVMRDHTYDARVGELSAKVFSGAASAPAREWSRSRVASALLEQGIRDRQHLRQGGPSLARAAGVRLPLLPFGLLAARRKDRRNLA